MPPVYQTLMASVALVAIVGPRVYMDNAPQTGSAPSPAPYVIWSGMGGRTNNYLGDLPGIDNPIIMFQIYANNASQREAIYQAMIAALDPVANMLSQPITGWDFETKLFVSTFEYSYWVGR